MPVKEIDWDKQDLVKCDDRGRATLGSEFANESVLVWISETPDPNELVAPDDDAVQTVVVKMEQWARENDIEPFDYDPETGEVEDKHGEMHQSPYSYDGEVRIP